MTPAARLAAVIEIIGEITAGQESENSAGYSAGQGLRKGLQRRRYAGSGDRNAISEMFWQIHRAWARLFWHLETRNIEVTPRAITIAAQVLINGFNAETLAPLFPTTAKHAAEPLTTTDLALIEALADATLDDDAMPEDVLLEWPAFLIDDAKAALGDDFQRELKALQSEAATDLRINPVKMNDRRVLRDKLAGRGIKCHPTSLSPIGIRLEKRTRTDDLQEFKKGLFDIQDEGSQIAALLCDARPGMQVADMCAGAAGKSLVMAAQMENRGRVLAMDSNAERLERGGDRIRRAGIHNIERKHVGDTWGTRRWRGKFDRVVIDAPCSGSGTWRRQVDARWRCSPEGLASYTALQASLLDKARAMVMPGGRIIYITCSVLASEGADQIDRLLAEAPELELADIADIWQDTIGSLAGSGAGSKRDKKTETKTEAETEAKTETKNNIGQASICPPLDNGMLRLLPGRDGTDGFFMAVLQARLR